MRNKNFSLNEKIRICEKIVERLHLQRSIERALIEYVDDISIFDFITDLEGAWRKAIKAFKDSMILSSMLLMIKYSERSLGDILNFFRRILPLARTEVKIRYKRESMMKKIIFRLNLLSIVGGVSIGIIVGLLFLFNVIHSFSSVNLYIYSIVLFIMIIMNIVLGALKLNELISLILLDDDISSKIKLRPILLALTSFLLAIMLLSCLRVF